MARITTYLSILTRNVNRLNSPIKRHCLANWVKKENPTLCCTHLIDRNKHWHRVKAWKIYQANGLQKKTGVSILISDKVDFKLTFSNEIKKDTSY
jgi:hypothetical protein